jgi:membrane protease YdiL (CAAX protease family)
MSPFVLPLLFAGILCVTLIVLNERIGLFRSDHFPTSTSKWLAYIWLGLLLFVLTALVTASSQKVPTPRELHRVPFYSLFLLHGILLVFLVGWWLIVNRPPIGQFLNIRRENAAVATLAGFGVGVGGWVVTLALAGAIALILKGAGLLPKDLKPSPMIPWMAALPLWKKATIVFSAMTVEEAFFRGWLQKRVGLIVSTILFALAHSGLGQPFLLIGVTIISLVIGFTFYRTKNLVPGVIAHGVFDAVQLFVIIPIVFRATGVGS